MSNGKYSYRIRNIGGYNIITKLDLVLTRCSKKQSIRYALLLAFYRQSLLNLMKDTQ